MRFVRFRWLTLAMFGFLLGAMLLSWGCGGGGSSSTAAGADMAARQASAPDGGPPAPPNLKDWEGRLPGQAQRLKAPAPEVTPEASPTPSPPPPPDPPGTVELEMVQGWNMVSFPVGEVTLLRRGTGVQSFAFWWNASSRAYEVIDPSDLAAVNAAASQGSARGFWFFTTQASTLTYAGSGQVQGVALRSGWNLISVAPGRHGDMMISAAGSAAKALPSAVCLPIPPSAGCIGYQNAFRYVAAQGSYGVVNFGQADGTIEPGTAVWFFAHSDAQLDFPGASGSRLFVPNVSAMPGSLAEVRILATSADPVAGFDLTLTVDPEVATFAGGIPSDQDGFHIRTTTTATTTRIVMVSPLAEAFQGTEVIRVPIRVAAGAAEGMSPLSVSGQFWSQTATRMADPAPGYGNVVVQAGAAMKHSAKGDVQGEAYPVVLGYPIDEPEDWVVYDHEGQPITLRYGLDFNRGAGDDDWGQAVRAVSGGVVVASVRNLTGYIEGSWGNYVIIDHGNGYRSRYAHLVGGNDQVESGKSVSTGEQIGRLGNTGESKTSHLHFQLEDAAGQSVQIAPYPFPNATKVVDLSTAFVVNPGGIACSTEVGCGAPSEASKGGFQACFDRNGGKSQVGCPIDGGGGVCAHWGPWTARNVLLQDFDGGAGGRGAIIDSGGAGTAYWIHAAIWTAYLGNSGPDGPLGRPQSDEAVAIAGPASPHGTTGLVQRFDDGSIYWSAAYGAYPVYGEISRTFEAQQGTGGPLGFPVTNPYTKNGALQQDFEGGTLREGAPFRIDPNVGCASSHGQHFIDAWVRGGGLATVGSAVDNGGGLCAHWSIWTGRQVVLQDFDGGSGGRGAIIDNEGVDHTTAHWLPQQIWDRYRWMGGSDSPLGRPTSDMLLASMSPQGTPGTLQRFEGGSIYSSTHGAWRVYGVISQRYEGQGGTSGPLGFPKGEQSLVQGVAVQEFEGGQLRANTPPGTPSLVSPADGVVQASRNVTFSWIDNGDPDGLPQTPTFQVRLLDQAGGLVTLWEGLSGSSHQGSVPSDGHWKWAMQSYDGLEKSTVSGSWAFTVDTTAPTVPGNFAGAALDGTRASLSWTASTDNLTGIQEYIVKRDDVIIARPTQSPFVNTGLTPGTTYHYTIAAKDGAGNTSAVSPTVTVGAPNQPPGAPVPVAPADQTFTRDHSLAFSWIDNGDPDGAPGATRMFRVEVRKPDGTLQANSAWILETVWPWLAPVDGVWTWTVRATDGVTESAPSSPRTLTVDTVVPSAPAQLASTGKTAHTVDLAWSASTDALSGIATYVVYRDGVACGTPSTTTYSDSGLAELSTHLYRVAARDRAGNDSALSAELSVTLPEAAHLSGDIDGDGSVLVGDLDKLLDSVLAIFNLSAAQLAAADLNESGSVDAGDGVLWLQRFPLGNGLRAGVAPRK